MKENYMYMGILEAYVIIHDSDSIQISAGAFAMVPKSLKRRREELEISGRI